MPTVNTGSSAADDAAGLAISEKMRRQIRGLNQGTRNAQDGVSWVQTGDGALNEAHDILHRMTELSVKALNETYTDDDRELMQAEFDHLQSELDRLTHTSTFNEKHIFQDHETPYYQFEGNAIWLQNQRHIITDGANDLSVEYRLLESDPPTTKKITVPAGIYTTQALIDEIDTALEEAGLTDEGLVFEYTGEGRCNLNLEGGEKIDNVSGGLSYLLYDSFGGGSLGALIGTTIFNTEDSALEIAEDYNDKLTFTVVNTDGSSHPVSVKIDSGSYTRKELIQFLQNALDKTPGNTVKAEAYGTGIKLSSEESIITGFKGNMFQIDTGTLTYTSVFYDNVQESTVRFPPGSFQGAAILPDNNIISSKYPEDERFNIRRGVNDTLVLKPNGASQETVITIPERPEKYTMPEMIRFLNDKIGSLGLKAESYEFNSPEGKRFQGIKIESTQKGVSSDVGIVKEKSTAYDTLFVRHAYKVPGQNAAYHYVQRDDQTATLTSGSDYTEDGKSALPLTITSGQNDQFRLTVNGTPYTITLDAGSYTLDGIKDQIDKQLNGSSAPLSLKGHIMVDITTDKPNGKILLSGDRTITGISAGKVSGNTGYEDIFVGQVQNPRWSPSEHTTATNNNNALQPDGTVNIDPSRSVMSVWMSGKDGTINVNLPTGSNVSQNKIVEEINKQLPDIKEPNTFNGIDQRGGSVDRRFTVSPTESYTDYPNQPNNFNAKGTTVGGSQGIAGDTRVDTPATSTISLALPENITITANNKHFACTLNGIPDSSKAINIAFDLQENRTYSRSDLVNELQTKITAACGGKDPDWYGGLKVELNSFKQLVFTAGLINGNSGAKVRGDVTQIQCSPSSCPFLKDLYRQDYPASITLTNNSYPVRGGISYPVDFGSSGQDFIFQLKKPGDIDLSDVRVNLTGSYDDVAALTQHISKQLENSGIPVCASYNSSKYLTLTTTDGASGYKLAFNAEDGGEAAKTIFGGSPSGSGPRELTYNTGAQATLNCDVQKSFEIDGSHNIFRIKIGKTTRQATLPDGTYDINKLAAELDKQLGSDVTVVPSGNKLCFITQPDNTDVENSRIQMQYDTDNTHASGGSSLIRIFGEKTVYGATASFKDGHLELTRNGSGGSVAVYSHPRNPFQLPDTTLSDPSTTTGWHSDEHAYIQGRPVLLNENNKVTIDRWNKNLSLPYYSSGSYKTASATLPEKEYTLAELAKALEGQLGADFHVSEKEGGILIEAANPGSSYRFLTGSGGFYEQILCAPGRDEKAGEPDDTPGKQTVLPAYVMGRKDVRHQITNIQKGVNDDLGMEFTLGGTTYPLKMTLDPGSYSSDALLQQVQSKLDEALDNAGLPKGLIEAGIGGFSTGVAGSDDKNALHFILSSKVPVPAGDNARCVIEAVSGTAAFSIFYQTEGDIARAYVEGTRDLSQGIEITDENGELSVRVDGKDYTVQIPPKSTGGAYMPNELAEKLNDLFKDPNNTVPLSASIEDGRLQLMHTKFGQHSIGNISGSAKNSLFFTESGNKEEDSGIPIQLSATYDDRIQIDRPVLNTASMRINSILISRTQYADKALRRLKDATQRVSEVRSYFGSMQNRIDHAINNNENKAENTAAAESAIRDADMSREIMTHIQQNILEQASVAMIAQANQIPQSVLWLLR